MAKTGGKTVVVKTGGSKKTETKPSGGSGVSLARPTTNGGENFYENSLKELQVLAQNDTYAKKVDGGALGEARGKDVWRLHATLKAVDDVGTATWNGISKLGEDLHTNSRAITGLVEKTRETLKDAIDTTRSSLSTTVKNNSENIGEAVQKVHNAVNNGFNKLSQATAGTEENLRSQTHAFSKEVATLLTELQGNFEKAITEFRDEANRLIDKRFNQSDVAFAAVRADQEVIKALLTDIIKDRMGRSESRVR